MPGFWTWTRAVRSAPNVPSRCSVLGSPRVAFSGGRSSGPQSQRMVTEIVSTSGGVVNESSRRIVTGFGADFSSVAFTSPVTRTSLTAR